MEEKILQSQPTIMPRTFLGSSVTELLQSDFDDESMNVETGEETKKDGTGGERENGETVEIGEKEGVKEGTNEVKEETNEVKEETSDNKTDKDKSATEQLKFGKLKITNISNSDKINPKPSIISNVKYNYNTKNF